MAPRPQGQSLVPPTADDLRKFIQQLSLLVQQEQTTEELESALLFTNCSFQLLEAKGLALGNLAGGKTTIGLGGKTLVELERPLAYHTSPVFPPHGFRPGDLVALVDHAAGGKAKKGSAAKEADANGIEGVVWKVLETKIVVALGRGGARGAGAGAGEKGKADEGAKGEDLEIPERIRILKVANPSTSQRQLSALQTLLRQLLPSPDSTEISTPSPLLSTLLGLSSTAPPPPIVEPLIFIDERLNASQREAVHWVLREAGEVALIWGPPGTGKTQTLVEIIRQLVAQDQRILICGGSNLSVDNLLLRLSLPAQIPIPLTRIGHPARVLSSLVAHTLDSQSLRTDSSEILVGIKQEIEGIQESLNGGGKRLRGKERRDKWGEVKELRKEYRRREGGVVKEVLGRAKVVLATCHGAGSRILERDTFDVVIIDEAAQAVEPSCWIPILKGKKLILAGDHLQLPPTIKSLNNGGRRDKKTRTKPAANGVEILKTKLVEARIPPSSPSPDPSTPAADELSSPPSPAQTSTPPSAEVTPTATPSTSSLRPSPTLELTLFSRLLELHGPTIRKMLKTQYRFNSKIQEFPSQALYGGELVADESVCGRKLSDLEGVDEDEDLDEPVVFIDTAGAGMYERSSGESGNSLNADSKSNENEAALVVKYIDILLAANVSAAKIAIISPYNSQVSLLASLVHPEYTEIEIGSVDGFQGREQEVVIISLVRSNEEGEVGFLSEQRRLNVAMTRARSQLVVVGDSETVAKGSKYLKAWMDWLESNAAVRMADTL